MSFFAKLGLLLVRDKEQSPVKKGDKGSSGCPQHWIGGSCCPREERIGEAGQGHLGH